MPIIEMASSVARLVAAGVVALGVAGEMAQAQSDAPPAPNPSPLVVELYTSQGCSSCPPADALLRDLAQRDDVIALALHVDYWDYIGWADIFARPEHAVRQKAYARVAGDRMIYTPQMVLGGTSRIVGAKAMAVMSLIEAHRASTPRVGLELNGDGGGVIVEITPLGQVDGTAIVQLVRYRPESAVDILRGENAGKTLQYSNIVTAWDTVAEWDGSEATTLQLDLPGEDPAVVIVQEADHGAILAAAKAP